MTNLNSNIIDFYSNIEIYKYFKNDNVSIIKIWFNGLNVEPITFSVPDDFVGRYYNAIVTGKIFKKFEIKAENFNYKRSYLTTVKRWF